MDVTPLFKSCLVTTALAFAAGPFLGAQPRPATLREVLARDARITDAQLRAIEHGEVVVRTLPTGDARDVSVMGLVRVDRLRQAVIDDVRATRVESGRTTRAPVHLFATPPSLDDVGSFHLTAQDLNELTHCQPNACNFKLPAAGMAALSAIANSKSTDAALRAEDYLRRRVVDYVTAYRERGNATMIVYDDLGSVQSGTSFDAMLRDSTGIFRVAPELAGFLLDYPRASLPDASSVIYWAETGMPHVRPVMRIMHEVSYTPAELPGATVVAAKQLYADHYFEAGLEVLTAVDDSVSGFAGTGHGTVVIALRHYRFDHLPSGGMLNLQGRVIGGMRDAVANELGRLRGDAPR